MHLWTFSFIGVGIRRVIIYGLKKHAYGPADTTDQEVYFFFGIVKGKRRPHSSGNSVEIHHGLCTVLPSAHSNAHLVQEGSNVIGMQPIDVE